MSKALETGSERKKEVGAGEHVFKYDLTFVFFLLVFFLFLLCFLLTLNGIFLLLFFWGGICSFLSLLLLFYK